MKKRAKNIISAFTALCMLLSLMTPVLAIEVTGDDGHKYGYTGAELDKEYDGQPVSLDVSEITVDGESGKLSSDNSMVLWFSTEGAGGTLDAPPSGVGSYWVQVSVKGEDEKYRAAIELEFAIWEQGHEHTFDDWAKSPYDDYHARRCGCGYRQLEKHTASEWQIDESNDTHYKVCTVCGNEFVSEKHTMTLHHDDEKHWEECDICGYKIRESEHNIRYTDNNDGKTHKAVCTSCEYSKDEPHNFSEWQPVASHGEAGQYQYRTCAECGYSEERTGKYTVTYDFEQNGGTSVSVASKEQEYGTALDLTPKAVKNGYEFIGWSLKSGTEPLTDDDDIKVTGDITLYAIFRTTQNVRFYSKNGSVQTTIKATVYNNEKSFYINDLYPNGLEPDAYEDWEICGWTDSKLAGDDIRVDLHSADGTPMIPDVFKDYYALYIRNIELTYDAGEYGTYSSENELYFNSAGVYSECAFVLQPVTATTEVKDFEYWAIGDKEKGEKHKEGETIAITENTTAYAVFTGDLQNITKYSITYDYAENGGTAMTNQSNPSEISEGETLSTANLGDCEKAGWDFVGWNTDPNAKTDISEVKATGNIKLYAIFKKTITGSFAMAANELLPVSVTIYNKNTEGTITAPELPAAAGWTPCGWQMSGDNSGKYLSGAVKLSEDRLFTPVYVKYITLTYDTNGSSERIASKSAVAFRYGDTGYPVNITLENAPVRDGYEFTGWALSSDTTRGYNAGDTAELNGSAVATAQWRKLEVQEEKLTVTYDYKTNGGENISATAPFASVEKGAKADLSFKSTRGDGWEFVGWNTDKDAHEKLTDYTVTKDVTLYAIFNKSIGASFYSGADTEAYNPVWEDAVLWNRDKSATVTAPSEAALVEGWTFEGWRADKHTIAAEYKAGSEIPISKNTVFYAVYSREISVGTTDAAKAYTQYLNTGGGVESMVTYMLEEPEEEYTEEDGETMRFVGWDVYETNEGEETAKTYTPGTALTVDANTTVKAKYIKVPAGATLPGVETVGASVISPTASVVEKKVENDNVKDNDIINQGFVYWSKLGDGTKYTVTTPSDLMALEFLAPDTEYYYYAFAENAAGMAKGYIKSFRTEPDGNTPTALTISPEYVSLKKGDSYQLLATLLPVSAENKILWSSSDPAKVTVDENGMLKAVSAGDGVIITATTEIGRLTAECIVDVTEEKTVTEMDFSEWHMASHTYNGYENGFDWDTEDADGGNHTIATAYLARWDGAVSEASDPYPIYNPDDRKVNTADEQYHVQNVDWLPARAEIKSSDPLANDDEIKSALMENGAVYSLMCIDWDCFDDSYTNYYCPNEINYNGHAITIVGWDDGYSKTNFSPVPPKNGAFICKNSWGENIGDEGYFYISYYDANMGRMDSNAVVTGAESKSNYNKIYDYDPLGAVGYIGYYDTMYAANVFPAKDKPLQNDEILKAVSFYTYHKDTSYDVYIVTDYKDSSSLSKLTTPAASGEIKNSGYHTVTLKNDVLIKAGSRFAVVVKLDKPGECSYMYCEYPVSGYSSRARANDDEGFYSADGSGWRDLNKDFENANFCIKAFTDNGVAMQSYRLYSAIDNENREYQSDKVYTLEEAEAMGMPVNDRYKDFVSEKEKKQNSFSLMSGEAAAVSLGSMPSITKSGGNSVSFVEGARFPSSYNLAQMGLVSSVKDQGSWGTCWAHAMYASLESCMLRSEKTTSTDSGDKKVILSRKALTMSENSSVTLAKKITPVGSEDKSVIWTSSDDSVAKVDTNGTIRAVKAGSATVSATTVSGGVSGSCSVVVEEQNTEETVTFETSAVRKAIGEKFMVAYAVTPMKAESSSYSWISDNPSVAAVNENGVIEAVDNGTAEISILSEKGNVMDTVAVIVGDGFNFTAEGTDIDASGLTLREGVLSGSVSAVITGNNTSDTAATVMLAVYKSDELLGFVSSNAILKAGSNEITFDNLEIEGADGYEYSLRCYTWNSESSVLPLAKAAEAQTDFAEN